MANGVGDSHGRSRLLNFEFDRRKPGARDRLLVRSQDRLFKRERSAFRTGVNTAFWCDHDVYDHYRAHDRCSRARPSIARDSSRATRMRVTIALLIPMDPLEPNSLRYNFVCRSLRVWHSNAGEAGNTLPNLRAAVRQLLPARTSTSDMQPGVQISAGTCQGSPSSTDQRRRDGDQCR